MAKLQKPPRQDTSLADSRMLRRASFAGQFLIGAEFEVYCKGDAKGSWGHCSFPEARSHILSLLKRDHPTEPWGKELMSFASDCSLDSARDSESGIEIVLKHCEGTRALSLIGKIMATLGAAPTIRTSADCGLHFNASFADPAMNTQAMLAGVHEHAPLAAMLSRFGRSRNKFCKDNAKLTFGTEDLMDQQGEDLLTLIELADGRAKQPGLQASLGDLGRTLAKLGNPKTLAKFQSLALLKAKKLLLDDWVNTRPACAPRLDGYVDERKLFSPSSGNYCEFRMMGGAGYLRRPIDVASTMQECLLAMRASAKAAGRDAARLGLSKPRKAR